MDLKAEACDFFGLVTELCKSLLAKCHLMEYHSRHNNTRILNKMRTTAFEILLNKHHELHNINDNQQTETLDPFTELLKHSFVLKTMPKSSLSAKKLEYSLDNLIDNDGNYDSSLKSILYFLYYLKSYEPPAENDNLEFYSLSKELFNIGVMYPALSNTHQWDRLVPQYQIYPLSTLELPIKIKNLLHTLNNKFCTINHQGPFSVIFQIPLKILHTEISITSPLTPYDLRLRGSIDGAYDTIYKNSIVKLSQSQSEGEIEYQCANEISLDPTMCNILPIGISDLPLDIENRTWEALGNVDVLKQSSFVTESSAAMGYFENIRNSPAVHSGEIYLHKNRKCHIITMAKFVENSKLVLLGIESNFYIWNNTVGFTFNDDITVSGLSRESLENICSDITCWATCFKLLSLIVYPNPESGELRQDGLIFKSMCNNINDILIHYQAAILQIFSHNNSSGLLNLLDRLRDVGFLMSEVARLCQCDQIRPTTLSEGIGTLSHIYNQVTKITKPKIALVYYSILKSCCEVYYQLLEKWIFEGTCDEAYGEFMIKIRGQYLRNRGHKFWTRCFGINNEAVPGFLKNLTDSILQCGKTVRLLKICDPKNPICNLFSTKRPTVKVCLNMNMLSEQEEIYSQYMADGIEILGSNVTLSSAFREIKALEKDKADHVIDAQHDTLKRIKQQHDDAKLQLIHNKRQLLADQKKQCEDAASRRQKAKETILIEDKLLMDQQLIDDEKIKGKQLADRKATLEYYNDLTKEVKKRHIRAIWRAQRMSLFDKRMNAISMAHLNETNPNSDGKSHEHLNNVILGIEIQDNNTALANVNSIQEELIVDSAIENDENCNRSCQEINQQRTIKIDKKCKVIRPTVLDVTTQNTKIIENKIMENVSIDATSLETGDILNDIARSNNLFHKSHSQICYNVTGGCQCVKRNDTQNANVMAINHLRNEILPNDNNCNIIYLNNVKTNDNINVNNINQQKINNATLLINITEESSNVTQIPGNDVNDTTPMSCTTDSYVPSAVGSSVLYNCNDASLYSESKNEFETPTTPGDCPTGNLLKSELVSIDNIFSRTTTQCINPFSLNDNSPVIFQSSLTKADVEILDNTSLQVYLEKSVLVPLRVQSHLANSAIIKCLIHDHKILQHLQSLRSFFFLLNGEFSKNLTGPLYTKFYQVSSPIELFNSHTLTNLLKNALHCSLNNSYINSQLLSLTVFENPSLIQILDPQALNCLCLHYKVTWPLNIIIDEALMQQYSKVFRFLLMVGRVLWVLQDDFCILKNERKAAWSHQYHRVQLFRHAMMQFMTALHNYITCSVLHESWTEFEKELENATTLDHIYTTHVSYIKKILSRCMLTNRGEKLRICLCNTFEVILKFHNCLRTHKWIANTTSYIHPNYKKLELMYNAFCTLRTYPAQVVDRSASSGYQMHLSHFVDALNINTLYNL